MAEVLLSFSRRRSSARSTIIELRAVPRVVRRPLRHATALRAIAL